MPWSDQSDPEGASAPPPRRRPRTPPGPWGSPRPSNDAEPEPERPRRPGGPPPRGPPPPPDLASLIGRARLWIDRRLAALGPRAGRRLASALGVAVVAVWLLSGFFQTPAGDQSIVTTFGAYNRTAGPGLGYHLPAPFERVQRVPTTALNETKVGAGGGDPTNQDVMPTADGDLAAVTFSITWRVNDARRFLFNLADQDEAIKTIGDAAMREAVARAALADVAAGGKARVEADARALMQSALDRDGAGVIIVAVQIDQAGAPAAVVGGTDSLESATDEAQAAINQANAQAAHTLDAARQQAADKAHDADAYRAQAIAEARGEADAFNAVDAQYRTAPDLTRERLYLETMHRVLGKSAKVVVDAKSGAAPVMLPPDLFRRPAPQASSAQPPAAAQ